MEPVEAAFCFHQSIKTIRRWLLGQNFRVTSVEAETISEIVMIFAGANFLAPPEWLRESRRDVLPKGVPKEKIVLGNTGAIVPGLYRGDYSKSGGGDDELIYVQRVGRTLVGAKITGNKSVTEGQVTFWCPEPKLGQTVEMLQTFSQVGFAGPSLKRRRLNCKSSCKFETDDGKVTYTKL